MYVTRKGDELTQTTTEPMRDVLSSRLRMVLVYGLPGVSIYPTGNYGDRQVAAIVWPVAFLVMGVACVAASALSALHGWRVMDLGPRAWELIGYGTFALAFVLYFAPEAVWGKYFRRQARLD